MLYLVPMLTLFSFFLGCWLVLAIDGMPDSRLQGDTQDWDATGGNQPRGTTLSGNLIGELGIWEKQSSFWFQAKSCQNVLKDNVVFNLPRAAINFNDGVLDLGLMLTISRISQVLHRLTAVCPFPTSVHVYRMLMGAWSARCTAAGLGGGTVVDGNVIWNTCRESGVRFH